MSSEQKMCMDEALLKEPVNQPAPKNQDGRWPSLLTVVSFVFLTLNSVMAMYRSNGDMGAISFVVFSYMDLVMLFYFASLRELHQSHLADSISRWRCGC